MPRRAGQDGDTSAAAACDTGCRRHARTAVMQSSVDKPARSSGSSTYTLCSSKQCRGACPGQRPTQSSVHLKTRQQNVRAHIDSRDTIATSFAHRGQDERAVESDARCGVHTRSNMVQPTASAVARGNAACTLAGLESRRRITHTHTHTIFTLYTHTPSLSHAMAPVPAVSAGRLLPAHRAGTISSRASCCP